MKKILLFTFGAFIFLTSNSQDLIIKKNGDEIKSKVLEVNIGIIKYKKYDNLNGPTFEVKKSDVFIIKYENGTKDVVNALKSTSSSISTSNDNQEEEEGALCFSEKHRSTSIIYGLSALFGGITSFENDGGSFFVGPLIFSFDMGLSKNISLAIRPAVMYYEYNGIDYFGSYNRSSGLFFGATQARLDFHFATTDKIDPYFGIGGGIGYFFGADNLSGLNAVTPLYGGGFGIKAYGKKKNAMLIELGFDSYSYLKLGYTIGNRK